MNTEHGSSENLTCSLSARHLVDNHAKTADGSNEAPLEIAPLLGRACHNSYFPRSVASIVWAGPNIQLSREETFQPNTSVIG